MPLRGRVAAARVAAGCASGVACGTVVPASCLRAQTALSMSFSVWGRRVATNGSGSGSRLYLLLCRAVLVAHIAGSGACCPSSAAAAHLRLESARAASAAAPYSPLLWQHHPYLSGRRLGSARLGLKDTHCFRPHIASASCISPTLAQLRSTGRQPRLRCDASIVWSKNKTQSQSRSHSRFMVQFCYFIQLQEHHHSYRNSGTVPVRHGALAASHV